MTYTRRAIISALLLLISAAAVADPHPSGLSNHTFNGPNNPDTKAGVTTFSIRARECSNVKYGDGRGETDCKNGNVRETLSGHTSRIGQGVTYSFDILVKPPVDYKGWTNSHAFGFLKNGHDSRLRIASWEGNRLHNFIYMLKLDGVRGVTFFDEVCVAPEDFGSWQNFKLETRWSDGNQGWARVTCNNRVVYFLEGAPSQTAPHCYITNQCELGITKNPNRFNFVVGPVMAGFGHEWKKRGKKDQFTAFDGDITIEVRNLAITKKATLYGKPQMVAVRGLQAHLTALGCNPGPVDGAMGPKTRAAIETCRNFDAEAVPNDVTANTVEKWLAAYLAHHPKP